MTLSALLVSLPMGHSARLLWAQEPEQPEQPGTPEQTGTETESPAPEQGQLQTVTPGQQAAEETAAEDVAASSEEADEEEGPDIGPQLGLSILGVASVCGGILFLLESGSSSDLADQGEARGDTPDRVADLRDRSDRESSIGIVLTSLGIAMMGVATYLWIRGFQEADAPSDEGDDVTLLPSLGPDGGGLVLSGSF